VTQAKDLHRDARSFVWLEDARWDLWLGVRLLRRNSVFTVAAAASLAIGIGATTTVFTIAQALLLQPPTGVIEPSRLVDIGTSHNGVGFGPNSFPNYEDIQRRATTLDGVYATNLLPQAMSLRTLDGSAAAERVFGTFATVNYFSVLGAQPIVGRVFDTSDSEQAGAAPIGC
jgi:putative ABC transport system permease protein